MYLLNYEFSSSFLDYEGSFLSGRCYPRKFGYHPSLLVSFPTASTKDGALKRIRDINIQRGRCVREALIQHFTYRVRMASDLGECLELEEISKGAERRVRDLVHDFHSGSPFSFRPP